MRPMMFVSAMAGLLLCVCRQAGYQEIPLDELRDKIAGGWAGKMIGVSYGAPTEFRAQGKTYDEPLSWSPERVANALEQDDLYVQMSFMMTMDRWGLDAPAAKFAESFATAGYRLWHANVQARKNFQDGILPPESGSPKYNLHCDDIDFQIESDYIGFICPAMPQTANRMADKIGHIMNYGDGVYGGMFVAALYSAAFFEREIDRIVASAVRAIPPQSDYRRCVEDVIRLHQRYPDDWRAAWQELEQAWGDVDLCGALVPFNIDAKLNGAYIVMGLLYGQGDFAKTLEISTRCGQDSDCNPSNAAAVIGVMNGYRAIPEQWKSGIAAIADSQFIFTDYSFRTVVDRSLEYAKQLIVDNGGRIDGTRALIKAQPPLPPALEVSFPATIPIQRIAAEEMTAWLWDGPWQDHETAGKLQARSAAAAGASVAFGFTGNGIVITGDWLKDGGKADVYLDGVLHRTIDTHYYWAGEEKRNSFLWHAMNLRQGEHTVTLMVSGKKKTESLGTKLCITGATLFGTKP